MATLPQTLTPYHAKYYAYELTRRCPPDSDDRLANALVDAQVDLNPHQIDAALFSFKSPLSRGVLLADEVGLGKTIEAGLVLAQRWAERKRRILVITPSNLRKQWHQELTDKFFLPCRILEAKSYNEAIKAGQFRPFEVDGQIVICSYQFARNKAADVHNTAWDVVVMDEAHRLRNVYKPSNVIANTLKQALASAPKLLLTATPLQNSLLELFGLVSIIDDQIFGDLKSFREQFSDLTQEQVFTTLKRRLAPVCHRTLRRQVTAYVSYTRRLPLVEQFTPDESEDRLYNLVSDYLRRENLKALPSGQRTLMTLVMRKLLASSSFAIAGALDTMVRRLKGVLTKQTPAETLPAELDDDYESLDETAEEWGEDDDPGPPLSDEDREALVREIADLEQFRDLATSITHNAKGDALLKALQVAFDKATELGGAKKAIIFTESRKTQLYLQRLLADSPWKDGLVLFNGSNIDELSRAIYAEWRDKHEGTDHVTGSRTADMRSALVDYFRDRGQIMIATEAGAEGINLQFCSLVVNYDLPWNPQRIEQRIGRCHRYGQKHDVVVVNFLNKKNAADQRVFQLLSEKFKLFEGVFGASDEVLGAIESGVDFEKRIATIYQQCRKTDEIQTAFDRLQLELDFEITDTLNRARQQLLEHFDDEVREKLRIRNASSRAALNRYEQRLMALTRFELGDEPTEIVVHVNMLKEGWDVTNLYTIVPLRAANARTLVEQSIGRGLRLPYGERTGITAVDRLNIVAHDRFQEIVDDANKPDSPLRIQAVEIALEDLERRVVTVESNSILADRIGSGQPATMWGSVQPETPLFASAEERQVAQVAMRAIEGLSSRPTILPGVALLRTPEVQAQVVREVRERWSGQLPLEGVREPIDVERVVAALCDEVAKSTIDIPRVLVVPIGRVESGFSAFTLDLSSVRYPPVSADLWVQHLRTQEHQVLTLGDGGVKERRLEDYVVRGLVDFDDVSYDEQADLLYDLAGQAVRHFLSYLSEEDTRRVLQFNQHALAAFIHAQMQEHYWEKAEGYEVTVSHGFTPLKPSAYTAGASDAVQDYRVEPRDKTKIGQLLFGAFARCLYRLQKFGSDTERRFAVILEREALRWFRPAKGQFQIFYRIGSSHQQYVPDFVAETGTELLMIETKARNEMATTEVEAKRKAAEEWCRHASDHAATYGGKRWRYGLVPHDTVADNMTLDRLTAGVAG